MNKVLVIVAHPLPAENSWSQKLGYAFLDTYRQQNPDDEIVIRNLYESDVRPLDAQALAAMAAKSDSPAYRYAHEFAAADKIVVMTPFWNFSIPAILKCYIDYVVFNGISFRYEATGPVGLLKGKKVALFMARGGFYTHGEAQEMEFGAKYLKSLFGFLGIAHIDTVIIEGTGALTPEDLAKTAQSFIQEATDLAKKF